MRHPPSSFFFLSLLGHQLEDVVQAEMCEATALQLNSNLAGLWLDAAEVLCELRVLRLAQK